MNKYLTNQKTQLQIIIGWIDIIAKCDVQIKEGHEVDYFSSVRAEAVDKYSNEMANMVGEAIKVSKVKAFA